MVLFLKTVLIALSDFVVRCSIVLTSSNGDALGTKTHLIH